MTTEGISGIVFERVPNCVARKIADTGRDARPYEPAAASPMKTRAAPRGRREPPRAADASRPARQTRAAPRGRCRPLRAADASRPARQTRAAPRGRRRPPQTMTASDRRCRTRRVAVGGRSAPRHRCKPGQRTTRAPPQSPLWAGGGGPADGSDPASIAGGGGPADDSGQAVSRSV